MIRYPPLDELMSMDGQSVSDHIARHLLEQGRPCRSPFDSRLDLYRGPDDQACAIIPEDLYSCSRENRKLSGLIGFLHLSGDRAARRLAAVLERHYCLLDTLQDLHDDEPVVGWPAKLERMARIFDLDPHVLRRESEGKRLICRTWFPESPECNMCPPLLNRWTPHES
jgi:hypothetical protein